MIGVRMPLLYPNGKNETRPGGRWRRERLALPAGGCGLGLRAGFRLGVENACKLRRIPPVRCTRRRWAGHHFEREKQGCAIPMGEVYSEMAGAQAERSIGDAPKRRLPWCTVVSGRIDLKIGGARIVAVPARVWDRQLEDTKRPR